MDIEIKDLNTHEDSRGLLVELIDIEVAEKHQNTFGHLFLVSFNGKKEIRGNHYHKKKHEYYIVTAGTVRAFFVDVKTLEKKNILLSVTKGKYQRLRIGPNIAHACYGTTKAKMIAYYSDPYRADVDTYEYLVIK